MTDDPGEDVATAVVAEERAAEVALYALFRALSIAWTHYDHPPMGTVADSVALRGSQPGAHVKNMFLKEKKGGLWLVTCLEDREIRIRDLEKAIGAKGSSFGKPDLLFETLGVRPGAVTPFALMAPGAGAVRFVLDQAIDAHDVMNAHPMHNRATTAIAVADFARFLDHLGREALRVDFDALEALARERSA
ncbi:MAG: prolyl-tRNA synthetase associated domain-containing protein [Pseudomonadota bacterium]